MMIGNSAFVGAWSAELEAVAGAAQVVPAAELVGQLLTVLQSTSVCPVAQTLPLAVSGSAQQDEAVFLSLVFPWKSRNYATCLKFPEKMVPLPCLHKKLFLL